MATIKTLDTTGLKSPEYLLKIVRKAREMKPDSILQVRGNCRGFEGDVRAWCKETGRSLLSLRYAGNHTKIVKIQF
jgi:TusA-related sulfurtransferase